MYHCFVLFVQFIPYNIYLHFTFKKNKQRMRELEVYVMVYGYISILLHHVFKGRNIGDCLFAYLEEGVFSKWGLVLWEEFASVGAISCPYEMTPFYMGGNYDNDRVAYPESVSICLN